MAFLGLKLMLFDSPKDLVFGKILVFGNILRFPGVNWAQKWTKTVNFIKHCVFLFTSTSGQDFSKIEQYLGE